MVVGDCLFANLDVLAVRIKSRFFFLLLWSVTNHERNILDYLHHKFRSDLKIIDEIYFEMYKNMCCHNSIVIKL